MIREKCSDTAGLLPRPNTAGLIGNEKMRFSGDNNSGSAGMRKTRSGMRNERTSLDFFLVILERNRGAQKNKRRVSR